MFNSYLSRLIVVFSLLFASAPSLAESLYGRVVNVADGDTVTILDAHNQQHRIRLAHIDAPERGQAYGRVAQKALSDKIGQRTVEVKYQSTDRYGRIIGEIYFKNENINLWMVQHGYAWAYFRYKPPRAYINAHNTAKRQQRGLWQDKNPIEPENFRRR